MQREIDFANGQLSSWSVSFVRSIRDTINGRIRLLQNKRSARLGLEAGAGYRIVAEMANLASDYPLASVDRSEVSMLMPSSCPDPLFDNYRCSQEHQPKLNAPNILPPFQHLKFQKHERTNYGLILERPLS